MSKVTNETCKDERWYNSSIWIWRFVIYDWSANWQLFFFWCRKRKVIHFGNKNMRNDYYQAVQNCNIVSDSSERDRGVITGPSVKSWCKCNTAVKSANKTFDFIKERILERQCYDCISFVRPKFAYWQQTWRPYSKKDIEVRALIFLFLIYIGFPLNMG